MTRERLSEILRNIFGYGIFVCLIAGGITFFGYWIGIIIGGPTGEAIAKFLFRQYFPIVIRAASIIIILGLVAMYLGKEQALSLVTDKAEADEDIKKVHENS